MLHSSISLQLHWKLAAKLKTQKLYVKSWNNEIAIDICISIKMREREREITRGSDGRSRCRISERSGCWRRKSKSPEETCCSSQKHCRNPTQGTDLELKWRAFKRTLADWQWVGHRSGSATPAFSNNYVIGFEFRCTSKLGPDSFNRPRVGLPPYLYVFGSNTVVDPKPKIKIS